MTVVYTDRGRVRREATALAMLCSENDRDADVTSGEVGGARVNVDMGRKTSAISKYLVDRDPKRHLGTTSVCIDIGTGTSDPVVVKGGG